MLKIGMMFVRGDISKITIGMDHAGKGGVTITLLCAGIITILTRKGMSCFVAA